MIHKPLTTLYIGAWAGEGGVFKSLDGGGASWSSINTGLTYPYVNKLAIDPQNPSRLYAGTDGDGVYWSINGGESWSPINDGLTNYLVQTIGIDPQNPATLYAGTMLGIFKGQLVNSYDLFLPLILR